MLNRRKLLWQTAALAALPLSVAVAEEKIQVKVWKTPTCGCCSKWVDHMQAAGFAVDASNIQDVNVYKAQFGLPPELASCHTALVDGYVVEGHVPPADVVRMLEKRPTIAGIAVPGMPLGSPGMESPTPENYQTVAFTKEGEMSLWAQHGPDYD
ncbi:MAG: DUF411 domain-containing protein [Gammaproteobacteria bacterium]